ncbi:ATP-binding cassette domain-containing protein [Streptomyces sp. CC224B]|uniref:ABC transporter ATP-binding protein n=1 Tax=Streptomyces sp. CC224B TaxID=3044571 RepID=UPI0024A91337|nr:ATP-binding cassette domain-containing protein [Streptomyces sp. CC224B]
MARTGLTGRAGQADGDLAIRLDGAGRRYGIRGPWVLREVSLSVRAGTLTRVEGANGTGKSTLLRLLARIDAPSEGRVTGRPRTAYVPERFPPSLPFTAVGYLTHMGRVHGLTGAAAARRAHAWLERLGAAGHAGTPLPELSKGTSQKVAVAQALLADPELLVLDEAWTGLDAAARDLLDRAVAERVAAGSAVAFVDHDPHRLAGYADVTYAISGTRVTRRTADADPAPEATGRTVVVEARGPHGAELPPGLPGTAGPGPEADTYRLVVADLHSDLVLRELLTASPPWHVLAVRPGEKGDR